MSDLELIGPITPQLPAQTPLYRFESIRPKILSDVVDRTLEEFSSHSLDLLLGEALYSEKQRLKRDRGNIFTRERLKRDRQLWNYVQSGLVTSSGVVDRDVLLKSVLGHYAQEVGGHFDPKIYRFATHAVPMGFDWLLNAASVRKFLPWRMTESVKGKLQILGEVSSLQKLAQKGTILLVPTHQSNIDSVLIGYVIYLMSLGPFAYGAGLNLFSNPALSFFLSRLGAYTVDRQKSNAIYKQVLKNYSTRILREGVHSIFFPGGGRARSGAIETKLKLGLLGTGLEAQTSNMLEGKANPNVYIVPMVMSYHFVLEASSLIEDYLAEAGKHRFIITDDESWQTIKVINFFWKLFSAQSNGITVRLGKPLDVFGNFVDDEGRSIGPNGTTIDPAKWLSSHGQLKSDPARDHEYTRELGVRVADRFHKENTVLTSHLAAFSFFEALKKQYPELDLYRFLRISLAQRSLPIDRFYEEAESCYQRVRELADRGGLYLSLELQRADPRSWVLDGVKNLGLFHDQAVLKMTDKAIWTEDMPLLYYYRNRLSGYGLERSGLEKLK